jgi:predicted Zn-dependent peptidase
MTTVKKTILSNGVKIISKAMPYVRSVTLGIWVNVGARDESAAESGLSHFIEHMIFKGTKTRSAIQIAKEFDAIGGQSNAFTAMEQTCYHAKVVDEKLGTMVEILTDIFLNPLFDQNEIEKERPIILQEIGMMEDSPEEFVHMMAGQNYWGDHPLGRSILGKRENILSFDADMIRLFFERFYQPERILITAAGNIYHQQLIDILAPYFESIKPTENGFPPRKIPTGQNSVMILPKALEQVHICLSTPGLAISDRNRFVLALLNTVLGGNMSSRLFQKIRENKGLAYAIYSFSSSHQDAGMFGVYTAVNPNQDRITVELILDELAQLKRLPISSSELSDSKEYIKGNLYLAAESPDNQIVRLAHNELYFDHHVSIGEVVERVESVSVEDIHQLTQTLFMPDRLALSLLGQAEHRTALEALITG